MDDELKRLLAKNLEVSQKTLKLAQKLHRTSVWRKVFTMAKWTIIIGFLVFGFIQIQPYIDLVGQGYQGIFQTLEKINTVFPK